MLLKRSDQSRKLTADYLRSGEVVVIACDTIYGFVGKVPDTDILIRQIKGRGETNPFLQLISEISVLESCEVILPDSDILRLWPGPFTFVFPLRNGGSAAYRIPEDNLLRSMIRELGFPLYSTSVNRSGAPALNNPDEIEAEFGGETALVEDSGILHGRQPSTVVDLRCEPYRILRQGAGILPPSFLT